MFGLGRKETVVLTVKGMSCGHCEHAVETALGDVDGVKRVEATREDERVDVTVAHGVDRDRLVAAVQAAGYEAQMAS